MLVVWCRVWCSGFMATVFKRNNIYIAKLKLWDDKKEKWVWSSRSTGLRDKNKALAVAVALENASAQEKRTGLKKEDAERLVNSVLRLAGGEGIRKCEEVGAFIEKFIAFKGRTVAGKTTKTSEAHAKLFLSYFSPQQRLDEFTPADLQTYYQEELLGSFELSTARNHVTSIRRWFNRAVALNEINYNPAAAIELLEEVADEKQIFTPFEVWKLLKVMLKEGRRDWAGLTLLGWHTGARIQDALNCSLKDITEIESLAGWNYLWQFEENKKAGKGKVLKLPLPGHVVKLVGPGFKSIRGADNYNGKVSEEFIAWITKAGIDPVRVTRKKRDVHLKSFHSFRHTMQTRLAAANVSASIARMITGHESAQVARHYTHDDVNAVAGALRSI